MSTSDTPQPSASRPRPLWPPRRIVVSVVSLLAALVLVRAGMLELVAGSVVDRAVTNIITLILGFAALVRVVLWFLAESGHPARAKRAVGWGLVGLVLASVATLQVERVSGDLVPELVFRWSPSRDRLLPRLPPPTPLSDTDAVRLSWAATPSDFPRFLGPSGDASIASPALDPDWSTSAPRQVWRRPIGAGWSGFAVRGDHAVTLEQRGEEELVTCYGIADGEPEWSVAVPGRHQTVLGGCGPRSTPTIHDDVVYATGATGWLHAIDGATGEVLWRKNVCDDLGIDVPLHTQAVAWGRAGSPLVVGDLVVVPGGGPLEGPGGGAVSLVAYDRTSGERRWTGGTEQISYVSPQLMTIGGREAIVSVNEASVSAHDPLDGAELWRFDWPGHSNSDASCSQPHLLDDGRLFLSKGYGIGAAVFEPAADGGGYRQVWSQRGMLKTKFTNVIIHEGHAYGLSDGILECVRLADGARAWKGGRYGQGQVLRVAGQLLVQAESGEVVLVACSPQRHEVLGRVAALAGQTWNNPCLSGNRLLVRNAEEAACYELRLAAGAGQGR